MKTFQEIFLRILSEKWLERLNDPRWLDYQESFEQEAAKEALKEWKRLEEKGDKSFCSTHNVPANLHPSDTPVCNWSQPKEEEKCHLKGCTDCKDGKILAPPHSTEEEIREYVDKTEFPKEEEKQECETCGCTDSQCRVCPDCLKKTHPPKEEEKYGEATHFGSSGFGHVHAPGFNPKCCQPPEKEECECIFGYLVKAKPMDEQMCVHGKSIKVGEKKPPEKEEPRWRAEIGKEAYHYITEDFTGLWFISKTEDLCRLCDSKRWMDGNYFQHRHEAEEALKKIKQVLANE